MCTPVRTYLRRFQRDDAGTITIETILIVPVVMWAFMATFVFFDAFASRTASQRAAYTVSDALGRQQLEVLTPEDIEGYNRVYSFLAGAQPRTNLRVSSVIWNPVEEQYEIVWSHATNDGPLLQPHHLTPEVLARLPVLPERESVYVVETRLDYVPVIAHLPLIGRVLDRQVLREFIVARPRFAPQLQFDDGSGVVGNTFPTCDDPGALCNPGGAGPGDPEDLNN